MKLALGCCLLVTLGLVSCGGTSGNTTVNGTDPASIKAAPAGVSTLTFMDLELVRPDQLTGASALPGGVSTTPPGSSDKPSPAPLINPLLVGGSETLYCNGTAANGGAMGGNVGVTWIVSGATTTYTETFNLTVTVGGASPTQTWVYAGHQTIAVTGNSATVTTPLNDLTVTFTDLTVHPNAVKVFQFSILTPLQINWNDPTRISLSGEYVVSETIASVPIYAVSATISAATPLLWTTTPVPPATKACGYPYSGTLTLGLTGSLGTDSTTVVFNSTCGDMTIGGASLNLGQ